MTVTKLDVRYFSRKVKDLRDDYDADYGSYREFLRDELAALISAGCFISDEWQARQSSEPGSHEDIVGALRVASSARGERGATEAQIQTIARLAVRDKLSLGRLLCDTLTRREAANIISSF